jgi:hypothetical protein
MDVGLTRLPIGPTTLYGRYGTAHFKKCLNTNIYSYLETFGGQSSNLYLDVVYFFHTSVN